MALSAYLKEVDQIAKENSMLLSRSQTSLALAPRLEVLESLCVAMTMLSSEAIYWLSLSFDYLLGRLYAALKAWILSMGHNGIDRRRTFRKVH
ncbi:hypothetical protein TorRG33x02_354160 [Trema orientale]|uniref:Uncharacterized protein n=1 Tax=Trema orientale TaxID=63057 RepID=A0A2P5ABL5_TREOI|nr:hypothetical protein TorRG33x02_354160 [Trema orientale]